MAGGSADDTEVQEMGLKGMVVSIVAFAAGAVMYWAVTTQGHGFRVSTVGVILMVAGGVGLVVSAIVFGVSSRTVSGGSRTYDREATDAQGGSTSVHEEVH
jgi:hypothetical protein